MAPRRQAYGTVRPRDEHHEAESPGSPSRRRTANMEQLAEQWENPDQEDERKRKAEEQLDSATVGAAWTPDAYPTLDEEDSWYPDDATAEYFIQAFEDDEETTYWQKVAAKPHELDRMDLFAVYHLEKAGSPNLIGYAKLPVRWVEDLRASGLRC